MNIDKINKIFNEMLEDVKYMKLKSSIIVNNKNQNNNCK